MVQPVGRSSATRTRRALVTRCALALAALALAVAGCGGGQGTQAAPASLQDRLDAREGEDVGLILGTSDLAVGTNRLSFLVVNGKGQVVTTPTAKVYVARTLEDEPESTADARLLALDPHGEGDHPQKHAEPNSESLFVARLEFERPGKYWFVVDLPGNQTQGIGAVEVKAEASAPAIGSKAIPSDNPTVGDAPVEELTTARPPDTELLRSSVKDALAAKVPFVVVFATPKYCTSRTCGPTVEIVDEVRKRVSPTKTRFIHVEVYRDNDPAKGVNQFMTEWRLPTEPWVFVVDADGVIRERFEGSASVEELEAAVRSLG